MEGPAAADGADDEYMAMDAEQWSDHEDIYENGDTADRDPGGREARGDSQETAVANRPLQNAENPRATQPSGLPLPDRYISIRRPPLNGSGRKRLSQLALLRVTTLCLVVLCLLLIGSLVALSIAYNSLAGVQVQVTMRVDQLQRENNNLKEQIGNIRNLSRPYFLSSTQQPQCLTVRNLYILNFDVLEPERDKQRLELYKFLSLRPEMTRDGSRCIHNISTT